jgi:hypothetical protein
MMNEYRHVFGKTDKSYERFFKKNGSCFFQHRWLSSRQILIDKTRHSVLIFTESE